jgi:HSP20 family molecular chaperone IbpA
VGETLDIDGILNELERILLDVTNLVAEGTGSIQRTRQYGVGDELKMTSSVRVGFLDEMLSAQIPRPSAEHEPVIDVIQTRGGLRVLVHLPGVKKEDINVYPRNKSLVFEINSMGRSYRKEIPCDVEPSNVTKSMVENNSVVEITFAKKGRAAKR